MSHPAVVELTPTTVSSEGDAVGRDPSGRVVFVSGALPGERVRVEILSERSKSASGSVLELLEVSPDRVAPPCPEVARGCGACQWQHLSMEAQRRLKKEIVLNSLRVAGVVAPSVRTVELPVWEFRTTIRAGVTDGRAGFRRLDSHDIVAVDRCMVAHPLLQDLLVGRRYPGAQEVLLRCGDRTGERLVATTPSDLKLDLPDNVRRDHLHESAAGRMWRISADSFFQTRPDGVDALADLVSSAAGELGVPGSAIDLYSGVGIFAGVLAERGWSVTAVESDRSAVADARVNLAGQGVRIVGVDVARWRPSKADLVVADPSRFGLGRNGVEAVAATGARRLVLISCDAVSLGRDAALLGRRGYRPASLTLVDLFPQTFHVEVAAVFDR